MAGRDGDLETFDVLLDPCWGAVFALAVSAPGRRGSASEQYLLLGSLLVAEGRRLASARGADLAPPPVVQAGVP